MRVECPNCEAGIHLAEPPDDDTPVKCPKCKARFTLEDDEDDDHPAKSKKGGGKKKEAEKKFPVIPVVGGGIAVLAIAGVVIAVMAGGKSDKPKPSDNKPNETASNTDTPKPPETKPNTEGGGADTPKPAGRVRGKLNTGGNTGTPKTETPTTEGDKKSEGTSASEDQTTPPETPKPGPKSGRPTPMTGGETPGTAAKEKPPAGVPAQYAELFGKSVETKPPMIRAATLEPASEDTLLDVPTFYSLRIARQLEAAKKKAVPAKAPAVPKDVKLSKDEVEKACAYIKVEAGDQGGTGSGFLIGIRGNQGLVATNHHVISAAISPRFGTGVAKITVVFNSGTGTEKSFKGDVIAFDPVADLAIVLIDKASAADWAWPKVLNPYNTPSKVERGTDCQFWGFPLGAMLAGQMNKNPQISLGKAAVSSFQENKEGKMERVIISGTMNPGNSGGPLVDTDGRLIGVAVAIVNPRRGTGIGYAVPVDDLIALIEGKLWSKAITFIPTGIEGDKAKFLAVVPVMDPMDNIETIYVRRWAGDGDPPKPEKDPNTGHKPVGMIKKKGSTQATNMPGVEESKPLLKIPLGNSSLSILAGEVTMPVGAKTVVVQVASRTKPNTQTGSVLTAASKPIAYTLKVGDVAVATDTKKLSELTAGAASMAGQTITVKARVASPPSGLGAVQSFIVVDPETGKRPEKMRFLVSRDLATQFDEVELEHQPLEVRMVCLVGKADNEGVVPVRVARLDFISRGTDHIVRTIPGVGEPKDKLFALNRDPKGFAGRSVEFKATAMITATSTTGSKGPNLGITVLGPGLMSPRNVNFHLTNRMKELLIEDALKKGVPPLFPLDVKIVGKVDDKPGANGVIRVTVQKIIFIDPTGGGEDYSVGE
jgi:S1-C subfamily serine protease